MFVTSQSIRRVITKPIPRMMQISLIFNNKKFELMWHILLLLVSAYVNSVSNSHCKKWNPHLNSHPAVWPIHSVNNQIRHLLLYDADSLFEKNIF